jgi:hypothetical protein
VRVFLITAAALSLSFYAPSALGQSSATQALNRAYCDDLDESHPDYYECWLDQILSEDAASREVTTEESAQLDEMVESSRMIAAERRVGADATYGASQREYGDGETLLLLSSFVLSTTLGVTVGTFGGWFLSLQMCPLSGAQALDCFFEPLTIGGTVVGGIGGVVLGYRAWQWAWQIGESPLPVSVSPYRHDDASGLMFSGQF